MDFIVGEKMKKKRIKVYIAGALNSNAIGYINNLHRMIFWSEKIRKLDVAVFVPGNDLLMGLVVGNYEYTDYFENSQPFLDVCDAIFLVPGWEKSKGTRREIKRAEKKVIPVFDKLADFKKFLKGTKNTLY